MIKLFKFTSFLIISWNCDVGSACKAFLRSVRRDSQRRRFKRLFETMEPKTGIVSFLFGKPTAKRLCHVFEKRLKHFESRPSTQADVK